MGVTIIIPKMFKLKEIERKLRIFFAYVLFTFFYELKLRFE